MVLAHQSVPPPCNRLEALPCETKSNNLDVFFDQKYSKRTWYGWMKVLQRLAGVNGGRRGFNEAVKRI